MNVETRSLNPHPWAPRRGSVNGQLIVGMGLLLAAVACLVCNERRAVTTTESLVESRREVKTIAREAVDPYNEAKLVHVTGPATTDAIMEDNQFGIRINALRMAQQTNDSFRPYSTQSGRPIYLLEGGLQGGVLMIEQEKDNNFLATWFLRFLGGGMMLIGFGFLCKPLSTFTQMTPVVGKTFSFVPFLFAIGMTLLLAPLTIAFG